MTIESVRVKQLSVGDHVRIDNISDWNNAIVERVDEGYITLFRPYGTTADFHMGKSVICYIGLEKYEMRRDDTAIIRTRKAELK